MLPRYLAQNLRQLEPLTLLWYRRINHAWHSVYSPCQSEVEKTCDKQPSSGSPHIRGVRQRSGETGLRYESRANICSLVPHVSFTWVDHWTCFCTASQYTAEDQSN